MEEPPRFLSGSKILLTTDKIVTKWNDVEKTLNRAGIALRSSQNDWRDMYDVLDEVATKWKDLEDTQRSQIATALGGTRQKEVVLALMENWDRVAKYVKIAQDSTGSASDKMQYYLESIQAATNRLKATWEEFVYSEGTVKFITGVINLATSLLDILNKIGDWFDRFGWTSEDFKKEADDTQSKIQDNIDRINEINSMSWQDKTSAILEEKRALEAENEELEKNLKLQREKQARAFEKDREYGGVKVTTKRTGETTEMSRSEWKEWLKQHNYSIQHLDVEYITAEKITKEYANLTKEMSNWNSMSEEQINTINSAIESYSSYIQILKSAKESGIQLKQEEQNAINAYDQIVDAFERKRQAATDAENALVSNAKKLIENEKDADKARAALTEFVKEQIILNNSKLDLSQQIAQLNAVAKAAGAASDEILGLSQVTQIAAGGGYAYKYNGHMYWTKEDLLNAYWGDLSELTKPGSFVPEENLSGGSGGSGSSDPNAELKKAAQNQIKLINKMKDKIKDDIDKINDKWDEEANALDKANEKLEKQIEYQKLLEAMAKAKSQKKMIYKDGRFQYLEDIDAISEAQNNLEEFYREKDLQDKKDYIEEQRKLELGDLEAQQKYLEDKINYWNDYIDRLDTDFASYMDIFDDFLNKQKNGYLNDLEALKGYVENKEALLNRVSSGAISGSGYGSGLVNGNTTGSDITPELKHKYAGSGEGTKHKTLKLYAEGTTNASGGLSVVGEKGAELRVLNRGDGIIPADITKNLWKWGAIDPERVSKSDRPNIQNYNIDVDSVNLPDVTNPEEFISGIKNLALQRAYNR